HSERVHSERVHSEHAPLEQVALETATSARSPLRFPPVDSLAAESAPPRVPGSVGPISSSRAAQQRRDSRQRTALIAGGLLAVAVIVTLGRLLLSGAPEDTGATASHVPAPPTAPGTAPLGVDPIRPAAPAIEAEPP